LAQAKKSLLAGLPGELMAEDLKQVQIALGEITGQVTSDDLLGKIFSSFCIGK
jgi:tRNA modification GTPase